MNQLSIRLVVAAVLLLVLAACATSPASNQFPDVTVYGRNLRIDNVERRATADGTPQVVVFGTSTTDLDRPARYRALWFDADGHPIKTTVSTWSELTFVGRRPFDLSFVGPGTRAARHQIEIEIFSER